MLLLCLHLATELCRGNEGDMGSSESGGFSCGGCTVGTMYHPFYCQRCYRATGDDNEEYSCKRCKFGPSKSKRFICDECNNTDQKTTTITPKSKCCEYIMINNFQYRETRNILNGFPVYNALTSAEALNRQPLLIFTGGRWVEARRKVGELKAAEWARNVVHEYPDVGHNCPENIGSVSCCRSWRLEDCENV